MKAVTNEILLAIELNEVIEQRRILDRREEELKSYWKTKLNALGLDTVSVGGILISLVEKSRASLDRKSLIAAFGEIVVKQHERVSNYQQVDVKVANEGVVKKAA